jgi:H2-forming N5,N10-methylenetetrahydromethanopterin dehydrogenase-like enzyme
VRTLTEIRAEIERASEERAALLQRLSAGHDVVLADELRKLNVRIDELWDEHREARVRVRHGDRDEIIRRARLEERIDRAA